MRLIPLGFIRHIQFSVFFFQCAAVLFIPEPQTLSISFCVHLYIIAMLVAAIFTGSAC